MFINNDPLTLNDISFLECHTHALAGLVRAANRQAELFCDSVHSGTTQFGLKPTAYAAYRAFDVNAIATLKRSRGNAAFTAHQFTFCRRLHDMSPRNVRSQNIS